MAIKYFFEVAMFEPLDAMRVVQKGNWWIANIPVWIMICVLFAYFFYWIFQLIKFNKEGQERVDVTAHSYFDKK